MMEPLDMGWMGLGMLAAVLIRGPLASVPGFELYRRFGSV